MDKQEILKKVKILGIWLIVVLSVWFVLLNPLIKFKGNEKKMLEASKRYFEVNSNELPTGDRTKTIYLKDLYSKAFLKEDFYIPLTKKACSVTKSWTKVRKVNGEYRYYVYLKCGVVSSIIDHKGPEITLNGDDTVYVDLGEEYKELGVKSVTDNKDGNIDINNVTIDSKNVNTKKIGSYNVTYTVSDSINNTTVKVRKVKVVSRIKKTVQKSTNNLGYYKGENPNNYIYFSGMLFRIVDVDRNNVRIIADQDIANVNYDGIEKWLDNYYYNHLTENSKKLIVENKYCNMNITDKNLNTTECSSYTSKRKSYIASITDVNKSMVNGISYLKPETISWVSNKLNDKNAYVTRNEFYGSEYGKNYITMDKTGNYGVRPIITIKGDSLIKDGNGTFNNPYYLGDYKTGKSGSSLNKRITGEYIKYSGYLWRIIEVDNDGTTKVILDTILSDDTARVEICYDTNGSSKIYNAEEKGNIGYFIANKVNKYIDVKYFVKKEIKAPVYKEKINYGKEVSYKKSNAKTFAPDMYEMFSAASMYSESMHSYWLINSSKAKEIKAIVSDIGVVFDEKIPDADQFGIRVVGYMNKNIQIVNGDGTINNPYVISK
ncbi:MAG: DUF5011 domain-containing protein [Firmicutes bacterium]|nr:DUF5011 domain-containing protein [Bacillota bacterium]